MFQCHLAASQLALVANGTQNHLQDGVITFKVQTTEHCNASLAQLPLTDPQLPRGEAGSIQKIAGICGEDNAGSHTP